MVGGIDFVESPITEAKRKAKELGVVAEFLQMDALRLPSLGRQFDSGLSSRSGHRTSSPIRSPRRLSRTVVRRLDLRSFGGGVEVSDQPNEVSQRDVRMPVLGFDPKPPAQVHHQGLDFQRIAKLPELPARV